MANNYSVTIHIAGAGTKLKNGGESAFGHMWYELDRGDGSKPESYGFAPKEEYHGNPFAPGKVYKDDSDNYDPDHYTKRIEITEDQLKLMQDFAKDADENGFDFYKDLNSGCVDFTSGINSVEAGKDHLFIKTA